MVWEVFLRFDWIYSGDLVGLDIKWIILKWFELFEILGMLHIEILIFN